MVKGLETLNALSLNPFAPQEEPAPRKNEKQNRLHQTFLQAKTFTKKMLTLLFC